MSLFNTIVRPHSLAPALLALIAWGPHPALTVQPYPLLGRMRYTWMNEDYTTVKILLKDGPDSWSEEKEEVMNQIKSHESFVKVDVLPEDPVYLVAEFKLLTEERYRELVAEEDVETVMEVIKNLPELDKKYQEEGEEPITKDPFVIFEEQVQLVRNLPEGVYPNEEVRDVIEKIKKASEDSNGGQVKIIEV